MKVLPNLYYSLCLALLPVVVSAQNPDAIYPIPANKGSVNAGDINFFNATVQKEISLFKLAGKDVAYELKALYNSASANLVNQNSSSYVANELGGYGWKMMDYPKIVQDISGYHLLDGKSSYPLQQLSEGIYTVGSEQYLWRVFIENNQWHIADGNGTHYYFRKPAVTKSGVSVWNFTTIRNYQATDSINFEYNTSGILSKASNTNGDTFVLNYETPPYSSSLRLSELDHSKDESAIAKTVYKYQSYTLSGGTYEILSEIMHLHKISAAHFSQKNASLKFSYLKLGETPPLGGDNYPGALSSITTPEGAITTYSYKAVNWATIPTFTVVQYAVNDGYNNYSGAVYDPQTYNAIGYDSSNVKAGSQRVYLQFNKVSYMPGGRFDADSGNLKHPYGSIEYYYLNGQNAVNLIDLPASYPQTYITSGVLEGLSYQKKMNNDSLVGNNELEIVNVINYWDLGYVKDSIGGFPKLLRSYDEKLGIGKWMTYTYGTAFQLPKTVATSRRNPDPATTTFNKDSLRTEIVYAFEKYDSLALPAVYMINTVGKKTAYVQEDLSGPFEVSLCECTQWGKWDDNGQIATQGYWAPKRYLQMRSATADTSQCFTTSTTNNEWLVLGDIKLRSAKGSVLDSTTVSGSCFSRILSNNAYGEVEVAVFQEATASNVEGRTVNADYLGFEAYETDPSINWTISNKVINTNYAHTGDQSFSGSMQRTFTSSGQDGRFYVFNAWVGMKGSGDSYQFQFTDAEGTVIGSSSGSWSSSSAAMQLVEFSAFVAENAQFTVSLETQGSAFVDDIVILPANSNFEGKVYAIERNIQEAALGLRGATAHLVHNRFNSLIAQVGPGSFQNINNLHIPYNSRRGNLFFNGKDTFDIVHPNSQLYASSRSGGNWQGFQYASNNSFPPENLDNMSIENDWLTVTAAPATATFNHSIDSGDIGLYVELFPNNLTSSEEIGISVQLDSLNTLGEVVNTSELKFTLSGNTIKLYTGTVVYESVTIDSAMNSTSLLLNITDNNYLYGYINGRYVFEHEFNLSEIKGPATLISTNVGGSFDNFVYVASPTVYLETYDALLRAKQKLTQHQQGELAVSEILYGGPLNMPLAQSRSAIIGNEVDKNGLSYKTDFASGFNSTDMTISDSSQLADAANYDNPFSSSVAYSKSPMLSLTQIGGGAEFTVGQSGGHYTTFSHEGDAGNIFNYVADELLVRTKTEPNGVKEYTYTSREEVLFAKARIEGMDTLKTQYAYDNFMRLEKTYLPNYYNKNLAGNAAYINEYEYDFVGNMIEKKTPDGGSSQFVYDPAGRLRFEIDSVGMASAVNIIEYYKYDVLGRIIETGTLDTTWDRSILQQKADQSPAYPSGEHYMWRAKYTYDGQGLNNDQGHLVSSQTNWDTDNLSNVYETFQYDEYGNNIEKALYSDAFGGNPQVVQYEYDLQNRIIKTSYPTIDHPGVTFTYNGNNQIVGVGIPGDPDYYAWYEYGYETVEYLNNRYLMRKYSYNDAGWATQINDPVFNEVLGYESTLGDSTTYDYNGKIASLIDVKKWLSDSLNATFSYNDDARLTVANYGDGNPWSLGLNTPVTYDLNGNIQQLQYGVSEATVYNYAQGTNQVSSAGGKAFTYNGNGQITDIQSKISGLVYDPITNLTTRAQANGNLVEYEYNGNNQRVYKKVTFSNGKNSKRLYVHGLNDYPLMELYQDSTGVMSTALYIYGPKGLIAIEQNRKKLFVLKDHQGSVRALIDTLNVVKASFDYGAFGNTMEYYIDSTISQFVPFLNYRYTGQEFESELGGIYNYRARLYDPGFARFLSPDPKMQYPSPYEYVGNNPINMVDPTGEWSWFSTVVTAVTAVTVTVAVIVTAPISAPLALAAAAVVAGTAVGTAVGTASGVFHDKDSFGSSLGHAVGISAAASVATAGVAFGTGAIGTMGSTAANTASGAVAGAVADVEGIANASWLVRGGLMTMDGGLTAVGKAVAIKLGVSTLVGLSTTIITGGISAATNPGSSPTPVDGTNDGISTPLRITQTELGISGRDVWGYYSIVDLRKVKVVVPDNHENPNNCLGDAGCYENDEPENDQYLRFPFRTLKNNTGLNPDNGVYYPAWSEVYDVTLSTNANFWDIEHAIPYLYKCTNLQGLSVGNGVFVSDSLKYGAWLGGGHGTKDLSYNLDALIFYKDDVAQSTGRYAEIIPYADVPLQPLRDPSQQVLKDKIQNAVGGFYYLRNGFNSADTISENVMRKDDPIGRTVIGINDAGTELCVLQVNGEIPTSTGITCDNVVSWFQSKGYNNLLALDGSGSSAFLYQQNGQSFQSAAMDKYNQCVPGSKEGVYFYRPSPNFMGFIKK